jgi:quinoprotein glucose dehydrogenase
MYEWNVDFRGSDFAIRGEDRRRDPENMKNRNSKACVAALALAIFARGATKTDWPYYGGDQAGSKYSELTEINRGNVKTLRLAWEWHTEEKNLPALGTRPGVFEVTPLAVGNVLYLSTPYNRVAALDAVTGKELWAYDPKAYELGQVPNGTGFVHRGIAYWYDSETKRGRILMNARGQLLELDSATGKLVKEFGDNGIVNLLTGFRWSVDPKLYTNTSPAVVYKNLIIVGNGVADKLAFKNDPPGDVRAFDAHTGKLVWTFHTVPHTGEFGSETWEDGANQFTGHTNVWAPMTLDEPRGLLYMPVSTPSNDFYGGRRAGKGLFGESLVCLDANTGLRRWHYQIVHHGLWDYDLASPPNLVTIRLNGRPLDAVVQLTKQGFVFVFDRVTGTPVWPITEQPVQASDVPGEHAWATQPVPSKPPAISPQGVSLDDAFDLSTELKKEAQNEMAKFRVGPLFTPPSFKGTLMLPGIIGGANWGGGAFDPETGTLYVKTTNLGAVARLMKPDRSAGSPQASETDGDYVREGQTNATFHDGLPLFKPPYGHLVAVDLNEGTIKWQVPFGDDARLRAHPALKGLTLPAKLGAPGVQGSIVTKGGIVFVGGGDAAFHAVDKSTGQDLWEYPLKERTSGTPMTYSSNGRQYVVIAAGTGVNARLLCFTLPSN